MGVPFGFSIQDIAAAIKLSKEIYDRCFNEDQGASKQLHHLAIDWLSSCYQQADIDVSILGIKYKELISDIRILGNGLERLQGVVYRYAQNPQREWHMGAHDMDVAERLWPQLTGDFHKTLQECDSLLSRHGSLQTGRTNVASNLRWWLSAEGAVDSLMARVRWHITKVEFYTRPSEFDAIIRNGSEIQQLRRQVARPERLMINGPAQSENLSANAVSDELKGKFELEFRRKCPSWSVEGSEWPLKEAFGALAFHFAAGTVNFNPAPGLSNVPELSQYVDLAKSIWILDEIKNSHHFQAAGTESIWADGMRHFEDDLRAQLHRFEAGELDKPSMQDLLELPTCYYSISSGDDQDANSLNAGEAGPLEEKILEIQLPSDSSNRESSLLVFRENETDFRLVTSTKQADTLVAQYDKEVDLNMDKDRLVPTYGNPSQGPSPRYNMFSYNEKGRKAKEFVFSSHEDIKKLQRALTGYRVHHDMPVARWRINGSEKFGDTGKGILQLWQFKPLPPMSATSASEFSDRNSSMRSTGSPSTSLATESNGSHELRRNSSAVSGATMISQSSVISPVRGPCSDGVEFSKPVLPVLMILTQCNKRYSFVHLTCK